MNEKRFVIHFKPTGESNKYETGSSDEIKGVATIYSSGKDVFVNYQKDTQGVLIIYDMMGKEILKRALEPNYLNKITLDNKIGYYIVRVLTENSVENQKIYIN